ncbi:MAG: TraR/DksA family transcriptional regulator [Gammaproteobacteria bacterium]|nr:TraR/DksA family transcriptional regulator [Gammaproteobacteria bacterium]
MREVLQAQRDLLTRGLADSREASAPVELDQTRQGRLSRMDAMQQQAMAQASSASSRARLAAIEAALKRMDEGSYGECRECGEAISAGRLRARPEARLCIDCESEAESQ